METDLLNRLYAPAGLLVSMEKQSRKNIMTGLRITKAYNEDKKAASTEAA
ncbi:hypothetical protein GCM10020331_030100 [Ectobacillus funiculus]